ncbi:hypothetical protein TI05_18845 [Achromatium sp. WMS3]|nr:hypothetical protein TI05_18845 [Achromatium sp. WMS3]
MGLNLFRVLLGYLRPILPAIAIASEDFLQIPPLTWDALHSPLLDHTIKPFKPLLTRITPVQIAAVIEASKQDLKTQSIS